MDWYQTLTHDPGCNLAYIRAFVSPDQICSCYQAVLDEHTKPDDDSDEPDWIKILLTRLTRREQSWTPWYATERTIPYYSTGALRITPPGRGPLRPSPRLHQ